MNQQGQEENVREHSFDGIQEFDKSLPNWWLFTLYGTIVFSIAYWVYYQKSDIGLTQHEELQRAFAAIDEEVAKAKAEAGVLDNDTFRLMAKDSATVAAGEQVYMTTCASCHGVELQGGIGLSLNDSEWKHGSEPLDIKKIVEIGVPEKGMPPWGPVLGEEKVNQVVAFVLSKHAN